MLPKSIFAKADNQTIPQKNAEKSLIVLSAPSSKDEYYTSNFTKIIDYMVNFANLVNGKDDVVILADKHTLPLLKGKVPSNVLIKADIDDIWIRDFAPAMPSKQIKFKYAPSYIPTSDSKTIDRSFKDWLKATGLKYTKSDIILDAGNIVDNAAGTRVIVTDRILRDNPSLTKSSAKSKLKQLLGVKEIAIIAEPPNDTTGHADGVVMWPTDDKILLMKMPEPIHTEVVRELKSSFPGVEIVEIQGYIPNTKWNDFSSAHNCFVNSIVTDNYIYMPMFNNIHDVEMLKLFQSHTTKTIVPVPSENVAEMGGSVRCLSWQVKNANKRIILKLVKQ